MSRHRDGDMFVPGEHELGLIQKNTGAIRDSSPIHSFERRHSDIRSRCNVALIMRRNIEDAKAGNPTSRTRLIGKTVDAARRCTHGLILAWFARYRTPQGAKPVEATN